jgi:hypothetical protein
VGSIAVRYALLALRDATLKTPSVGQWLTILSQILCERAMSDAASIGALSPTFVHAEVAVARAFSETSLQVCTANW